MNPLPRDAVLPQLAVALDPAAMAEAFADVLRPHGVHVDACRVERVKYRPGRNATLAYLLSLRDGGSQAFEQHVAARLCAEGDAQRTVRASAAALGPSQAGPALHWLPALGMLTWWWPNDRKLRAPRAMCDPAVLREQVLPALMPALGAQAADVTACELAVVQYVPELRLCTRVDLSWRVGAEAHARRVYGKASREQHGAIAHGLLAQLQASPAWREGRLRTPRALLWHEPTETGWQEGLPGEPLLDAPAPLQAACAAALGAQLAALHATPTSTPRETTPEGLRERLEEVVRVLWPLLGSAPAAAAQALLATWPALGEDASTLHGDFHGRNILVEDRPGAPRVALIDLDGLCRGPAVLELGAWIADAIYRALLEDAPAGRDQVAWRELIAAYVDAGGAPPDPDTLRWAVAWQLLTQRAWRCVVNLKPGRYALAPRLIQLATDLAQPGAAAEFAC
ncbi:phosphotransferase [Ramlibacter alkalitolerans]|uniref:Phosphotransferase n=1 Tax=Ramlibacter alkalitolerans TaxID=2039631 RepID=A0ABS1JGZ1_9BURK|nr:phosphotransferase [Ramlibacter alkalitolerans]MBL0423491.1 phosphotransferase [Ramlibacter alkalitolerans]